MNSIDKKNYVNICKCCDSVLLDTNATDTTIAIRWLHVLRWHPEYLISYNYLFNKSKIINIFVTRLFYLLRYLLVLLKNLVRSIFNKNYFYQSQEIPKKVDILFVSHLLKKNQSNQMNDFYFGLLSDSLKSIGYTSAIVLIDHTAGFQNHTISSWGKTNSPRLILSKVLPFFEEIKLYLTQFKEFIRLKKYQDNFFGFQRKIIIEASFQSLSPNTSSTLRIATQIQKLLTKLEVKTIVTTFEGQAWERLVFSFARANNSNIKCIGYLNATVFEFQHSIRRSLLQTYDPDVILTPGTISKEDLEGVYGQNTLIEVLGSNHFQKNDLIQARKLKVKTCLVAPEGVFSECNVMFEYSFECAFQNPDINFIWRLHPRLNFNDFLKRNSKFKKLPPNITLSSNSLEDDIYSSTHIIYRGSTVVIASISLGLIPIYLQIKDELSIDPLYNCQHGRLIVKKASDLIKAMQVNHNDSTIKYLLDYGRSFFVPFDEKVFKKVLNI
jgi:hypothetical protein